MTDPNHLLAASRPTRPALILMADVLVATSAPLLAHWLRQQDRFEISAVMTYWVASILCSGACFLLFNLERRIWRYFSWRELLSLATAALTTVSSASFLTFSFDRMYSVSRSEPLFHGAILLAGLIIIRVIARYAERSKSRLNMPRSACGPVRQALLVGTSPLVELYLRVVDEMASLSRAPVVVVGIVAEKSRHVGRLLRGRPITGTIEDLEMSIAKLAIHGIQIDVVVLGMEERYLSSTASRFLTKLEAQGTQIVLLDRFFGGGSSIEAASGQRSIATVPPPELGSWRGKRSFDVALSLLLLLCLAPLGLLISACVLIDIGSPIVFWQIRPGFRGVATRFYKIRTMKHIERGADDSDHERVSRLSSFLRRTRFDELPQLVNILIGQMSFVGPRPLLPRDLHEDGADRILMRPGVTGWAQVNGGKLINARDKMALDLWYAYNASLRMDLIILWRTVLTVLYGDRVRSDAIEEARALLALREHDRSALDFLTTSAQAVDGRETG